MKKTILIGMVLVILSIGMVEGFNLCYQEQTNESTVDDGNCGLIYTGNYSIIGTWTNGNQVIDGDFDTTGSSLNGQIYMNYTKPPNSLSSSLWRTKIAILPDLEQDLSLTSCWNGFNDKLVLRINVSTGVKNDWDCNDGTNWINLRTDTTARAVSFHEEAMKWDIQILEYEFIARVNKNGVAITEYQTVVKTNKVSWLIKMLDKIVRILS